MSTEQLNNALTFRAFYVDSGVGKTGLTVTVDVYNPAGTKIITDGAATEIGGGYYEYVLAAGSVTTEGEYSTAFKTAGVVDQKHLPGQWEVGTGGIENADAKTSTRLPTSGYTAPPSVAAVSDAVWDEAMAGHVVAGSSGELSQATYAAVVALNDPTAAVVADAVWDELTSGHVVAGSFGKLVADVNTAIAALNDPSAAAIADVVWDELSASHVVAASFGKLMADIKSAIDAMNNPTVAAIVDAVWDEAMAGHLTAGSTGEKLNASGSAGDPLTNVLGAYAAGTAGGVLQTIGTGIITSVSRLIGGKIEIIRGDDFVTPTEINVVVQNPDGVDLVAGTMQFYIDNVAVGSCSVTPGGPTAAVLITLPASDTDGLSDTRTYYGGLVFKTTAGKYHSFGAYSIYIKTKIRT